MAKMATVFDTEKNVLPLHTTIRQVTMRVCDADGYVMRMRDAECQSTMTKNYKVQSFVPQVTTIQLIPLVEQATATVISIATTVAGTNLKLDNSKY